VPKLLLLRAAAGVPRSCVVGHVCRHCLSNNDRSLLVPAKGKSQFSQTKARIGALDDLSLMKLSRMAARRDSTL
jgi:hypothetical protein